MKYLALLRGINVGGNNKVSMSELKQCFETAGFSGVSTYINSGNVIFESKLTNEAELVAICEAAIEKTFGFHVVCAVIAADDLKEAIRHAPKWWGESVDDKHNAIFVIAPAVTADVMKAVGEAKPEYEKVDSYGPVIFWTAPVKTFGRTRYSKIVGTKAYQSITIRNSNTAKKLVELIS